MQTEIEFKRGVMQSFVATREFAIGNTGVKLRKGQEILYDGSTLDVDGEMHPVPQLRGAIKVGWVVPAGTEPVGNQVPVSAGIKIRNSAQGGNPMQPGAKETRTMVTTDTDERQVTNVGEHSKATVERNKVGRTPTTTAGDDQEGVPVRALKTLAGEKAKAARTVLTSESAGAALSAAQNVQIEAGQGQSAEDMLARMDPAEREAYLAEKEALRASHLGETATPVVAKVRTAGTKESEGIKSTVTTGGGVETADLAGLDKGKAEVRVMESEGIKFTQTNGPKRSDPQVSTDAPQVSTDVRRSVAQQICADFPTSYDFTATPKKKIARLQADFEDRPDILKAVFAAETDDFRGLLVSEFPNVFR